MAVLVGARKERRARHPLKGTCVRVLAVVLLGFYQSTLTVERRRRRADPAAIVEAMQACRARHWGRVYHGEVDSQHFGKQRVTGVNKETSRSTVLPF
jgi:hypothetical protein